ncbi:hypothetical protein ACQFYA_04730 [Promicromonospora sp. Marseille-Q5078]
MTTFRPPRAPDERVDVERAEVERVDVERADVDRVAVDLVPPERAEPDVGRPWDEPLAPAFDVDAPPFDVPFAAPGEAPRDDVDDRPDPLAGRLPDAAPERPDAPEPPVRPVPERAPEPREVLAPRRPSSARATGHPSVSIGAAAPPYDARLPWPGSRAAAHSSRPVRARDGYTPT